MRARTSETRSAWHGHVTASNVSKAQTSLDLRPVATIDADIPFGEVASEKARTALAPAALDDADGNLVRFELAFQASLIQFHGETIAAYECILKLNFNSAWVE